MNLGIISLGCAKNLVDTEMFLGLAKEYDLKIVNNFKDADILVVNTCGFIESAKKEAIDTILELIDYQKEGKIIIAMGCLVERYLNDLKREIPEVDYYVPIKEYPHFDQIFEKITGLKKKFCFACSKRVISTSPNYAYLRIAEGCNNRCHYCAIPLIRGSFVSRPFDDIINEATYLAAKGISEINVIAQDTTRYGSDLSDMSLAKLLEALALMKKFKVIRVLYLYPDEITDELIEVIKKYDCLANYFDIPIQHASDKVLLSMNRRGNQRLITNVINKIRYNIPNAIIRTTLIVGFPGETLEDFNILKDYVQKQHFDRLGVFKYSDEENTKAFDFDDKIDEETKQKRYDEIMQTQFMVLKQNNEKLLSQTLNVIVDHFDNNKQLFACRSYKEAPDDADGYIYTKGPLKIGEYYNLQITKADGYDLYGEIINDTKKA